MNYQFTNDYCGSCHPKIMEALSKHISEQNKGYGLDKHSKNAEKIILERFNSKDGSVFFLAGGTQTNMVVISYLLKPYEAVIACDSGHINVHETGAVEASGHKIITCINEDGKLKPLDIEKIIKDHTDEHKVSIKMVYITDSTETGTIYSLNELKAIKKTCDKYHLYLFLDGARLASALTSKDNDIKPSDLSKYTDVFYIGGTKNGLLYGEAVVFNNSKLAKDFRYHIKNKGAMLAKGFVLGIMFLEAFKDNLYFDLAKKANDISQYIKENIKHKVTFASKSNTNQLFINVSKKDKDKLIKNFGLELWSVNDDIYTLRIVVSYMTEKEDADKLINYINNL